MMYTDSCFWKYWITINVTETHSGILLHLCVTCIPTYIMVTECLGWN